MNIMTMRTLTRVFVAASAAGLVLLALVPSLRHHALGGGWGIGACAVVSVMAGLFYLYSCRVPASERMSRADRARWAQACSLADVGELTAQWLEGGIASQPGYCGPSDIEDPALVPLLARLNRAGYVTSGSQAGEIGPGYEQRAAVEGFAGTELALKLSAAAVAAGLFIVLHDPWHRPRWRYRYDRSVTVTTVSGRRFTGFGVQVPRRHIRDGWIGYGACHPDAVTALCGAWQVTLIDPEWGRRDVLWEALAAALCQTASDPEGTVQP